MNDPLGIYLHDHLSAANFALELLDKMGRDEAIGELQDFARELHVEIEHDRGTLQKIAERVGASSHSLKEAIGWLGEKASRYKLNQASAEGLAAFESLEVLALGVLGKLALWNALKRVAAFDQRLADIEFEHLCARAERQHAALENRRLAAVADAFRKTTP